LPGPWLRDKIYCVLFKLLEVFLVPTKSSAAEAGLKFSKINIYQYLPAFSDRTLLTAMLSKVLRTAARSSLVTRNLRATHIVTRCASGHAQESFESFSERYVKFFQRAEDLFEVQRGLNNCFAHDLVPSPAVVEAAIRAARRVNDYATAVRIFEGIKEKVENKSQYDAYVQELKPLREELGMFIYFLLHAMASYFILRPTIEGGTLPIMKTRHGSSVRSVLVLYASSRLNPLLDS